MLRERTWRELLGGEYAEVIKPIRQKRTPSVRPGGLRNAVQSALGKLENLPPSNDPVPVLILVDADQDCPGQPGPKWLELARASHTHADVARVESEIWFVAAAESLRDTLDLPALS